MNRLSVGTTPLGTIDVAYMIDGMDISSIVSLNIDETISEWQRQHSEHDETPLEDWEVGEARDALVALVADAKEGHEWAESYA